MPSGALSFQPALVLGSRPTRISASSDTGMCSETSISSGDRDSSQLEAIGVVVAAVLPKTPRSRRSVDDDALYAQPFFQAKAQLEATAGRHQGQWVAGDEGATAQHIHRPSEQRIAGRVVELCDAEDMRQELGHSAIGQPALHRRARQGDANRCAVAMDGGRLSDGKLHREALRRWGRATALSRRSRGAAGVLAQVGGASAWLYSCVRLTSTF